METFEIHLNSEDDMSDKTTLSSIGKQQKQMLL